jgi:hypothetical protein
MIGGLGQCSAMTPETAAWRSVAMTFWGHASLVAEAR